MIYMALYVNDFGCVQINYLGKWEWVGPWKPQVYRLDAIAQGPKNSRFPGHNPLPLALVMDLHASKTKGHINHRCINSYLLYKNTYSFLL
jgi:hypothetical protein